MSYVTDIFKRFEPADYGGRCAEAPADILNEDPLVF